jgi:hypothetical protein
MADKGITKVQPAGALAAPAPDFIKRGKEALGTERLAQFVTPPLFKVVQKQSDDALQDAFGKGTTILRPADVVVAKAGTPFHIIPIIQYPEYVTWAPIELKGQVPAILARTLDQKSELARKATNRDTWIEQGYKFNDRTIEKVRHVEHITFIVALFNHEIGLMPAVMSFARAEHKSGRQLASMIKMRQADMFGCVFEAVVNPEPRKNEKGSWFGWDIRNPTVEGVAPWVTDKELYDNLAKLNKDFEEAYQNNLLRANYDDDAPVDAGGPAAEKREDM